MVRQRVYLATVCLERNRWGSREPSFLVSQWLQRAVSDGFDGVELWENHYTFSSPDEQSTLCKSREWIPVFNTYAGFGADAAEGEHRRRSSDAIRQLKPAAVKFNIGADSSLLAEYQRHLLSWADSLPQDCRLWCECHPGTILEEPAHAAAFFADMDVARFGLIAHLNGDPDALDRWMNRCGSLVRHLHLQLREPQSTSTERRAKLKACVNVLRAHDFSGSTSVEFTRGIGRTETIELIYNEAVDDLNAYRDAWS